MNTLKNAVKVGLATGLVVLGLGLFREAQAAKNPDTMTMTVSVNPASVGYGVAITSPEVQGYDFGAVDIAATTISTLPIAVKNTGSIVEFFSVGVVDVTNTYNWTNNGASLTPGSTSYVMQAQFLATSAGQPSNASFADPTYNAPSSPPVVADSKFNQATGLAGKTVPGNTKNLWLQLQMPTGVVETGVHTMVLTVNGQPG